MLDGSKLRPKVAFFGVLLSAFWALIVFAMAAPGNVRSQAASSIDDFAPAAATSLTPEKGDFKGHREPGGALPDPGDSDVATSHLKAALPYLFKGGSEARNLAVTCLAAAAWYEAGNDGAGQKSVIQVVLNRMRHRSFPKSACGVVFQGSERATGCQFSFTCDGSLQRRFPSEKAWEAARLRAQAALDGQVDASVANATHFHADYVAPWWSGQLVRLNKIGSHIFYRWPNSLSTPQSTDPTATFDADRAIVERFAGTDILLRPQVRLEVETPVEVFLKPEATASLETPRTLDVASGYIAENTYFAAADSAQPSGRWAVSAMNRCSDTTSCVVVSYPTSESVTRNQRLPAERRDRPIFMFVRDGASGMDLALWDCARIDRPNANQCLPTSDASVRRLMTINKS